MDKKEFNDWLDEQIVQAKRRERISDDKSDHEQAMYWFGRWRTLWDVKERIINMSQ